MKATYMGFVSGQLRVRGTHLRRSVSPCAALFLGLTPPPPPAKPDGATPSRSPCELGPSALTTCLQGSQIIHIWNFHSTPSAIHTEISSKSRKFPYSRGIYNWLTFC